MASAHIEQATAIASVTNRFRYLRLLLKLGSFDNHNVAQRTQH